MTEVTSASVWRPYRKSSFSADGACVEVSIARDGAGVKVRDSKQPGGSELLFNAREWNAFVTGVRAGEFELPA